MNPVRASINPVKSKNSKNSADLLAANQTSNGMNYVYILRSVKSGRFYTGFTSDLRKRLKEHHAGFSVYTKPRGPYELVYYGSMYGRK